jgi:hypothetical protein
VDNGDDDEDDEDDPEDGYDDEILGDEEFTRRVGKRHGQTVDEDAPNHDGITRQSDDKGHSAGAVVSNIAEDPNSEEALLRRVAELLEDQKPVS